MRVQRDERGGAIVEFAVVLPVLVLFAFGIIEFGRAYSARIELTNSVREGVRTAALGRDGCPPVVPEPPSYLRDCVVTSTRNAAPGLSPSSITVTPTMCPAVPVAGGMARVRATYPFKYDIPFFQKGTWTLTAEGVMRCGG